MERYPNRTKKISEHAAARYGAGAPPESGNVGQRMMKTILLVLTIAFVGPRLGLADDASSRVPGWLDTQVNLSMLGRWHVTNHVAFLVYRGGAKVDISPDVLTDPQTGKPKDVWIKWTPESMKMRYLISWITHLLDAKGILRGETVHIVPQSSPQDTSPSLLCFAETNGNWRVKMERALSKSFTPPDTPYPWEQYVAFIAHKAGCQLLIAGPVNEHSSKQKKIALRSEPQSYLSALILILDQVGAEYSLQGRFLYIRKKKETAQPKGGRVFSESEPSASSEKPSP